MTEIHLLPFGNMWSLLDDKGKDKDHSVLPSKYQLGAESLLSTVFPPFSPSKVPRDGENLALQVHVRGSVPAAIQFVVTISLSLQRFPL